MGKVYGYVRVSSKDQNVARQLAAQRSFIWKENRYLLIRCQVKILTGQVI